MKIINALVYTGDYKFERGEITIEGANIGNINLTAGSAGHTAGDTIGAGAAPAGGPVAKRDVIDDTIDAAGCYAIPGLIDIHLHGCFGYNFYEADDAELYKMLKYQAENGVTSVCPSTLTLSEDMLAEACRRLAGYIGARERSPERGASQASISDDINMPPVDAAMLGIHLEGPFISPERSGAQNPAYAVLPDAAMYGRLLEASGGRVKIIEVAPELEGATEFIKQASRGAVVSIAHTNADYATVTAAFKAGASHVTHLFNAMKPFTHREPNVPGAAFDDPGVTVEMITDGVHLHPGATRAAMRMFGPGRVVFISDSMAATGLGDGVYDLGGLSVRVTGNEARLVEGGNIASSVSNLMDCMRSAVKTVGVPLEDAVRCASENPARVMGEQDKRGRIATGYIADIVLLDADLNVKKVILRGNLL